MAINCTNHFLERWALRILDIKSQNDAKRHIAQHREKLIEDANRMFEYAEFVWKGQLYDNTTKSYFMRDNIILVADSDITTLITLFRTDYGFKPEINRIIAREYMSDLRTLFVQKTEIESRVKDEIEQKEAALADIEDELRLLEERLEILKTKKHAKSEEIKGGRADVNLVNNKIDEIGKLLCNSAEYKREIQAR